jgi:hypothetical protein
MYIKSLFMGCFGMMLSHPGAVAQKGEDNAKAYGYITVFYCDNSEGYDSEAMNDELTSHLRENLEKLTQRPDNYFFFYGSDGEDSRTSSNLTSFLSAPTLKKYLANPSRESDFNYDKIAIRDYFVESPVRVKQNLEINIYLSTHAVKRYLQESDDIPCTVFLSNELPMYVGAFERDGVRIRVKYYINSDAKEKFNEAEIARAFMFCTRQLNMESTITEIEYL